MQSDYLATREISSEAEATTSAREGPECQLSVIIPTWNSMSNGKSVARTIRSIKKQGTEEVEIIVVDNFSIDRTATVCSEAGVSLHQLASTRSSARNHGMSEAHGKFLLFLDSDEELEDGILPEAIRLAEKNNLDAVTLEYRYLEVTPRGDRVVSPLDHELRFREAVRIPRLYRKDKVLDLKFPEDLDFGEDYTFFQQFLKRRPRIGTISRGVVHYSPAGIKHTWQRSYEYGKALQRNHRIPGVSGFLRRLSILHLRHDEPPVRAPSPHPTSSLRLVAFLLVKYFGFAAGFLRASLLPN